MGIRDMDPLWQLSLPPGFRFYPTDEELLVQYLCRKISGHHFPLPIIGDVDLYKFDPWDLPSKAIFGEKEWYFFSPRDRKYPNGSRPNRVAGTGYWKATGTDKIILSEGRKVGIKKALVFYIGKAPKGSKTNWIMHEYRLSDSPRKNATTKLDDWVLCRIYKKNSSSQKAVISPVQSKDYSHVSSSSSSSQLDHALESLPGIDDHFMSLPRIDSLLNFQPEDDDRKLNPHLLQEDNDQKLINLQQLSYANLDWATLAGLSSLPEPALQDRETCQQTQTTQMNRVDSLITAGNDNYAAPMPPQFRRVIDEEVQSGITNNPSLLLQHRTPSSWNQNLSNRPDPFCIRYPTQTQPGTFGFR